MERRRSQHVFRSLRHEPRLQKVTRQAQLHKMYIETKIRMLEIIQDELQLKLDVQCVKEQFLGLLESYSTYDDRQQHTRYIPPHHLPAYYQPQLPPHAQLQPQRQAQPRPVCRCHDKAAHVVGGGEAPCRVPQHQVPMRQSANRGTQNSSSSSEEHRHLMHNHTRAGHARVPGDITQLRPSGNRGMQNSSSSSDEQRQLMKAHMRMVEAGIEPRVPPIGDYEQHVATYQQPHASPISATSSDEYDPNTRTVTRPMCTSRARVKAFYENRHERLAARRAKHGYCAPQATPVARSTTSHSPASSCSELDSQIAAQQMFEHTNTPVLSACSSMSGSQERLLDCDDFRNNNTPPKCVIDRSSIDSQEEPAYQNLLTPINEERDRSSRLGSSGQGASLENEESPDEAPQLPPRCPLIKTERYSDYLLHKSPPEDDGEYVTLKAPDQSMNSFFSECQSAMGAPSMLKPDITTMSNAPFVPAIMSMSFMSDASGTSQGSGGSQWRDGREKDSPVRYAKSNVISELYTKREQSLLNISQISDISSTSIAPSSLSDSYIGEYPLHSTILGAKLSPSYRAKQKLSFSDDDSLLARTDDTLDSTLEGEPPDGRASLSDTSAMLRVPYTTQLSLCSPKSDTGPYINRSSHSSIENFSNNQPPQTTEDMFKTPKNPPRRPRLSEPQQVKIGSTLCKEHGLHPTFGGPCIFEDSFDLIESDDSDLDFTSVNFNSETGSKISSKRSSFASSKISSKRSSWSSSKFSKRSSVVRHNSVADTDCDSSYLSECVDDTHFTNDFSEAENYTAMYDPRHARMRFMRRQTGHANIKTKRNPIGLSESDILETSQKHLSLQATRASMPDLNALSSVSSFDVYSDELSESTLRNSPTKPFFENSSIKELIFDQDETIISGAPSAPRPLSVCTTTTQATATTDESPESQGAMTVPVNSPNITDSGGSSSRQPTTDDYVDVPVNLPKMAKMLESRLQSHAQYPENTASVPVGYHRQRMRKRYPGSSAGSSHQSLGSKQSLHICSDPIPDPGAYPTKSRNRVSRKTYGKQYPKSQDSGFNTQESHARALHAHHYPQHVQIADEMGGMRTVVKHAAVARGLDPQRKKALAKKLKQFNNNFYGSKSSNLHIKTLGHF